MFLYHSTDDDGKAGIERAGFAVSHDRRYPNGNWFFGTKVGAHIGRGQDWWVIVDLPDEVAHKYADPDGTGEPALQDYYQIPFYVVNACAPFRYERQ
jgi:hypothetical protein